MNNLDDRIEELSNRAKKIMPNGNFTITFHKFNDGDDRLKAVHSFGTDRYTAKYILFEGDNKPITSISENLEFRERDKVFYALEEKFDYNVEVKE